MRTLARRAGKTLRLPLLALATVGVLYLAWMGLDGSIAGFEREKLPSLADKDLGERILVVAPHPDDETLGAGGLVRQALSEKRQVLVVVVTSGDGFRRIVGAYRSGPNTASAFLRLGEVRTGESRGAMALLGLPPKDLVFLGYPDGSVSQLWNADWRSHPATGTNGQTSVPYGFAYRPHASYTGDSLARDMASIVASFGPTAVVFPTGEDSNGDHWAVNAFVQYTLDRAGYRGGRYTYLVHRGHFPFPWSFVPSARLEPPPTLTRLGEQWCSYALTRMTERVKERALEQYRSQQRAMEPFLAAFVRRNELFALAPLPVQRTVRPAPSLFATAMPEVVLEDPAADTLLRSVDAGADLRRVALAREPDGVWLGLEARGNLAAGVTYRLSARLLRPGAPTERIDLEVRGRNAVVRRLGSDSLDLPTPLDVRVKGGRMWIRIPASAFDESSKVMVAAETYQGGMVLDRTSWRSVQLR